MAALYIVSTPIGNLEDITLRACRILREVDIVVAEDTRQTRKLLSHLGIKKPLVSFHQYSREGDLAYIIKELGAGKSIAYVVDAGTPGISDPGGYLVEKVLEAGCAKVIPIPGVSSLSTLLSVAGISTDRFLFLGFLPRKKGRKTMLNSIAQSPYPVMFFESPYRIIATLQELQILATFYCIVGRELTKKFEHIYRGTVSEVILALQNDTIKGELTVVLQIQKSKVKTQKYNLKVKSF